MNTDITCVFGVLLYARNTKMNITHNPTTQRFETTVDNITAYLSYDVINSDVLNYRHTIVPSELGRRGIGSALVKFALDYARTHNKKVVPSCSFVASYTNKYPEYQTIVLQ